MHIASAIILLLGTVTVTPTRVLAARNPGVINNLPGNDKVCADGTYNQDSIKAAISFAHKAWRTCTLKRTCLQSHDTREHGQNPSYPLQIYPLLQVQSAENFPPAHPKSGRGYPHRNTPKHLLSFGHFALPGCAQDNDPEITKTNFIEYPIIANGIWQGQSEPGNDRVVLQYVDHNTANFCGIMKHLPGKSSFQLCADPPDNASPPNETLQS
ncbi:MAG: hypothetical protein Q9191_002575 [Dirinaria sp. TL-2023a]